MLCSGKVYVDLWPARAPRGRQEVAVARVETLYPFPGPSCEALLEFYPRLREVVWVQEEPENMGAWTLPRARACRSWCRRPFAGRLRRPAAAGQPGRGLRGVARRRAGAHRRRRRRSGSAKPQRNDRGGQDMPVEIRVPQLGESVVEATVGTWLKQEGDQVAEGEPLVELETDKVNVEVAAGRAGVLGEDQKAREPRWGSAKPSGELEPRRGKPGGRRRASSRPSRRRRRRAGDSPPPEAAERGGRQRACRFAGGAPSWPRSTGSTSRTVERQRARRPGDARRRAGLRRAGSAKREQASEAPPPAAGRRPRRPSRRRLAAPPPPPPAAPAEPARGARAHVAPPPDHRPPAGRGAADRRHAHHLQRGGHERRHGAAQAPAETPSRERHGIKLGFMSFFTKAAVGALKSFPRVNAEIQGDELVLKHYYDIGVAVGTEEGLVVPVVRDADRKSFAEIEREIADLATRARENKLEPLATCRAAPSPSPTAASSARCFPRPSSTRRRWASWACTTSRSARWCWTAQVVAAR